MFHIRGTVPGELQKCIFEIAEQFVKEHNIFSSHIDPQNQLISTWLRSIVHDSKPISCVHDNVLHSLTVTNLRVGTPVYYNQYEIPRQLRLETARERNMTYQACIFADIQYQTFRRPDSNTPAPVVSAISGTYDHGSFTVSSKSSLLICSGNPRLQTTHTLTGGPKSRKRQLAAGLLSSESAATATTTTTTTTATSGTTPIKGFSSAEQIAQFTELMTSQTFPSERIAYIPVLLHSLNCHRTRAILGSCATEEEPPLYCIGGTSKAIPALRHLRPNRIFIFRQKTPTQKSVLVAEIRSISESDPFSSTLNFSLEKSYYDSKDALAGDKISATIPFVGSKVPVMVVLLALGFAQESIYYLLRTMAGEHWYDNFDQQYTSLVYATRCQNATEALRCISAAAGKDIHDEKQCTYYAQHAINRQLLSEVGKTESSQYEKGFIVAKMIWLLFMTESGRLEPDDRDHMGNISFETGATLTAILFRQIYNSIFAKQAQNIMYRTLEKRHQLVLQTIINEKKLTKRLTTCIATGIWSAQTNNGGGGGGGGFRNGGGGGGKNNNRGGNAHNSNNPNNNARKNVSQHLSYINKRGQYAQYSRLSCTLKPDGKHAGARKMSKSQYGRIDPNETPEGRQCGLISYSSLGTRLSIGSSPWILAQILLNEPYCTRIQLQTVHEWPSLLITEQPDPFRSLFQVFITGYGFLGWVRDADLIRHVIYSLRRTAAIDQDTSIYIDTKLKEIRLDTDKERLMRPLFVVSNLDGLVAFWNSIRVHMTCSKLQDLLMHGFLEYIDAWEEKNLTIAFTLKDLLARPECTHMEIDPCFMFSLNTALIPFLEFDQSPRVTYQTAMGKHSIDQNKNSTLVFKTQHDLFYAQRPLVSTMVARAHKDTFQATGCNVKLAILSLAGWNQDDGLIFNRTFLERGAFDSKMQKLYRDDRRRPGGGSATSREEFCKPDEQTTVGMKDASYAHILENGLSEIGAVLFSGDPVICKTTPIREVAHIARVPNQPRVKRRRDASTLNRTLEPAIVTKTMSTTNSQTPPQEICKTVVTVTRTPEVGDKFSSRHGQKGIVVVIMNEEDLPFDEYGQAPDVIMSPHGYPTRMTFGQLVELVRGTLAALTGEVEDGTPFRDIQSERCADELHKREYSRYGEMRYKDGKTGRFIDGTVVDGIVHFQKLKHMVIDKMHARATGPKQLLTRQPNEGRANDGGQRFGEMERDCLIAHGAPEVMIERLCRHSDIHNFWICNTCGEFAPVNKQLNIYVCPICKEKADIYQVESVWAFKTMVQEVGAMGMRAKKILQPF